MKWKFWESDSPKGDEFELTEAQTEYNTQLVLAAMQEGIDPGDLALAMEDRGWNRMNLSNDGELPWITRRLNIIKARMYWLLDPHATAAVRTWNNYTLGSGVTLKAKDAGDQKLIDAFMDNPKNRTVTSSEGQRKHNRRLLVDGEIFFAFFDTDDGVQMRKVDCIEVTEFITDPEDSEVIWAFKRERVLRGVREFMFYRNWAYPTQDLSQCLIQDPSGQWVPGKVVPEENVLLMHVPFDAIHQRGNSLFSSTLVWMTSMRQFMEDRIAITKGLAKYIMKLTFKGGKNQAQKLASAMSTMQKLPGGAGSVNGTPLAPIVPGGLPGSVPGGTVRDTAKTFLQNDQVSLDNMPRLTGASDAKSDHKLMRLMICAGVGMTEPYFGDAESGNLASATAMELPMLKQFEAHQKLWQDTWRDICTIVVNWDSSTGWADDTMKPLQVDVDFPPIVTKDIGALIDAIVAAVAEFPELKQPEMLLLVLNTLGIGNAEDVLKAVLVTAAENQKKADNVANGKNPDGSDKPAPIAGAPATPVVGPAKPAQQKTVPGGQPVSIQQAVETLAEALEAETSVLNGAAQTE
jgi:hypothetical protein